MFTGKMFMDARLIHLKASLDPIRICFPYDWQKATEDDQTLVYWDVCNSGIQDFDDIADIKVYALIKPQTGYIRCYFKIEVTAGDGSTYTRNRLADMPNQDACKVLNSFFAMGAPGMDIEHSGLFRRYYNEYLSKAEA